MGLKKLKQGEICTNENYLKNNYNCCFRYNKKIYTNGKCSLWKCKKRTGYCYTTLNRESYFYLAFENSFSKDYVTEKVLIALQNNAVPIVFGAADYSRWDIFIVDPIAYISIYTNIQEHSNPLGIYY